jgi:hypothetical protein
MDKADGRLAPVARKSGHADALTDVPTASLRHAFHFKPCLNAQQSRRHRLALSLPQASGASFPARLFELGLPPKNCVLKLTGKVLFLFFTAEEMPLKARDLLSRLNILFPPSNLAPTQAYVQEPSRSCRCPNRRWFTVPKEKHYENVPGK